MSPTCPCLCPQWLGLAWAAPFLRRKCLRGIQQLWLCCFRPCGCVAPAWWLIVLPFSFTPVDSTMCCSWKKNTQQRPHNCILADFLENELPFQVVLCQLRAASDLFPAQRMKSWVLRTWMLAGKGLKPQLCSQAYCSCLLIPTSLKSDCQDGAGSSSMGRDTSCGFVVQLTDSSPTLVFCQRYSVGDFWFVWIQGKLQYHIRIHTVALKNFKSRLFYQSSYCAYVKIQPNKHRTENRELGI